MGEWNLFSTCATKRFLARSRNQANRGINIWYGRAHLAPSKNKNNFVCSKSVRGGFQGARTGGRDPSDWGENENNSLIKIMVCVCVLFLTQEDKQVRHG